VKRSTSSTVPALHRGASLFLLVACLLCACGSELPGRYVIERDLDGFAYRRYQKTLGVEVPIEGNEAVGHTATYLKREPNAHVAVATAFVTVYERAKSLTAEARDRFGGLDGYRFSTIELSGENVWLLDGGENERWVAWVSGRHLVKLGAPEGEQLPEAIADAYLALYPSDLDEHGRALPDAASAGPSTQELHEHDAEPERDIPSSLKENAPK
jgi:hypothetical protein